MRQGEKNVQCWLAFIEAWAGFSQAASDFARTYSQFGLEESYQDFTFGLSRITVGITALFAMFVILLFAFLLYKGHYWTRWVLLAMGIGRTLVNTGRAIRIFRVFYRMPFWNLSMISARVCQVIVLLIGPCMLVLFFMLQSSGVKAYFARFAELREESRQSTAARENLPN